MICHAISYHDDKYPVFIYECTIYQKPFEFDLRLKVACTAARCLWLITSAEISLDSLMCYIAFLLADVHIGFEFIQCFVRQLSRNGLSKVSYINWMQSIYIHTCSCIIKVYTIYITEMNHMQ